MSTVDELFAPRFLAGGDPTPEAERRMAEAIGADSLRYLPASAIARCVDKDRGELCEACIDGNYPTEAGRRLYQIALDAAARPGAPVGGRTYELAATART
jgi:amidophosphoribosyltransferase